MTNEQKLKKLTGATAAVIEASSDKFNFFVTVDSTLAKDLLTHSDDVKIKMGVSADGNLWIRCWESDTRWVFPDKSLAVIAK